MRIVTALVLVLALAACGKKQAPQSPTNETEAAPTDENAEQNVETREDPDEMPAESADPCEGGE